jgi:hypothetical protein
MTLPRLQSSVMHRQDIITRDLAAGYDSSCI